MSTHKSMLCVGGPCAGQRYAVLHGNGFVVPVLLSDTPDPGAEDYMPNRQVDVDLMRYRAELFNTPEGEVSFWVPADQTPLQTITLLLETYERAKAKRQ